MKFKDVSGSAIEVCGERAMTCVGGKNECCPPFTRGDCSRCRKNSTLWGRPRGVHVGPCRLARPRRPPVRQLRATLATRAPSTRVPSGLWGHGGRSHGPNGTAYGTCEQILLPLGPCCAGRKGAEMAENSTEGAARALSRYLANASGYNLVFAHVHGLAERPSSPSTRGGWGGGWFSSSPL